MKKRKPRKIKLAIATPIRSFFRKPMAGTLIALIIVYKLTDALGLSLNTSFLMRGAGFSKLEIGSIYKVSALLAGLAGTAAAGMIMQRLSLFRSLWLFGILQSLGNLMFAWLAQVGHHYTLMVAAVCIEYSLNSMGTVAFVAFLTTLCHKRYAASQFALFTALASLGRIVSGSSAGFAVQHMGWTNFYLGATVLAIPSLFFLHRLKDHKLWIKK